MTDRIELTLVAVAAVIGFGAALSQGVAFFEAMITGGIVAIVTALVIAAIFGMGSERV